ncbi:DUF3750 domain-containing protein [uncultured Propionivibrio sp.]|uniref:DUF3750 domain-containing protein n=1 Tax=uncultured Propionivibrio sp. TaxID=426737 RepID=UPI0029C044EC|nr:DUF3750 domain-containing protein [uncultured Propionivibrio sp.]
MLMNAKRRLAGWLAALFCASLGISLANASLLGDLLNRPPWYAAPRQSAGIAPDPAALADTAIVQVYVAPTYGWRGLVAQHPWIIFKRAGETSFTRYDVIGWSSDHFVRRNYALPDGLWYGARPTLLVDHRGEAAAGMIPRIEEAIGRYPYPDTYRAYPGPNSNTFLAHIGREVPELKLDLPANAIGKDYRPLSQPVGVSPSGSGLQFSLFGMLGASIGLQEGLEFNVLGLNFGIDLNSPALRLPFVGRLGMDDRSVSEDR